MSLFNNLFGRKKPDPEPLPPKPFTPAVLPPKKNEPVDPSKDPNMIKVFDAYGREMFITKEVWRTKVLPGTLKSNWNNAEQLAGVVIGSMNDGFFADVLTAAEQLYRIDPIPARGACAYGIVLMKNNRLDDAENVFQSYIQKHGEDGSVLTNLAKVYSARKDDQKADEILWHALEVDPNQDNGLGWYWVIQKERNGEEAGLEALRRIPTGIFYAQGVKANVLFFDRKPAQEQPWTQKLWIYDLRTNLHFTLKENTLKRTDLDDFVKCYNTKNRHERTESERFKSFTYDELNKRDKVNLDIFWLKDDALEESANLPAPEIIAADITADLEAAMEQFATIAEDLKK